MIAEKRNFFYSMAEEPYKLKVFVGSRGGFFKKSPWPPEAKVNQTMIIA
jgi:hypothetical protein